MASLKRSGVQADDLDMRRLLLVALAAAALPASASAATISGTLVGGHGYTVLAIASAGPSSTSAVGANGRFSLKLPGAGSTLQLVKNGSYSGPVVLRRSGGKAQLVVAARGGKLGKIVLKRGYGLANAPKNAVSSSRAVRTTRGAPFGVGNLGYVKMPLGGKARMAATEASGPGADPDGDGVPSTFDADDNGNKTLDGVDPATARTSTAGLFSDVQVMMARSINANAGGISRSAVDAFVKNNTSLNFYLDSNSARGASVSAVDVDCGSLPYCRPGAGYATMGDGGNSPTGVQDQRWITLDTNHDGFPDVPVNTNGDQSHGTVHSIEVRPNATTADLHAGDLFQIRYTTPGGVITVPTALSLYFVSSPALMSYDGGAGSVKIAYPADESSIGSDQNPLMMSGDTLKLTFWRPQRAGIGAEPGFVDMGRLRYGIPLAVGNREVGCSANRYSGLSPTLSLAQGSGQDVFNKLFPLQDAASDAAPDAANTLELTLDVGGCLRDNGVSTTGQQIRLPLEAVDESRPGGTDRTAQTIAVCLPGCTPGTPQDQQRGGPQG